MDADRLFSSVFTRFRPSDVVEVIEGLDQDEEGAVKFEDRLQWKLELRAGMNEGSFADNLT